MYFPMRLLKLLSFLLFVVTAQADDLSKLVLPGKTFGVDWELTQPNLLGSAASPNYINRKLSHQPVVIVNIIDFKTPDVARAKWEKKFGGAAAATLVKKVDGMADAYDNISPPEMKNFPHMKRFMLFGRYWLTVEQIGNKDDRGIFIDKYSELIKKSA